MGLRSLFRKKRKEVVPPPPPTHKCLVCGQEHPFVPVGYPPRSAAQCLGCTSRERHRLIGLYFRKKGHDEWKGKRFLHFAPDKGLKEHLFVHWGMDYVTTDFLREDVDFKEDIQSLSFADDSFDGIMANEVLEHIPDDRKAMRELRRVLKPGGTAFLTVPIIEAWEETFEDPSITEPKERTEYFGQFDHVRYYGRDFVTRLEEAGFQVQAFMASPCECVEYRIGRGTKMFVAS